MHRLGYDPDHHGRVDYSDHLTCSDRQLLVACAMHELEHARTQVANGEKPAKAAESDSRSSEGLVQSADRTQDSGS